MDYMVSVLVVLLNQHWWGHTNSCFKQSRVTADASCCRYSFPRERIEATTFTYSGVQLKRLVAHEFINGYNYVIMATFKCNHDIQLLLGGKDAAERTLYCCKYVTKERLAFARKRVASIAYSLTSRQEIVGPLAALYLYRGSCCYSSTTCASVPPGDIVQQPQKSDGYTCYLVREGEDAASSQYRAVSFLDDYIFRPEKPKFVGVYEFAMRYFRKRDPRNSSSSMKFRPKHPLFDCHSLGQRNTDMVPIIHGYRLPYIDSESSAELQCKRAVLSHVRFKPFRSITDLIGARSWSDESWLKAYAEWEGTRNQFVRTIMNNMNDYYYGLRHAPTQKSVHAGTAGIGECREQSNDKNYGEEDNDCLFDKADTSFDDRYAQTKKTS
ncbi:hypothetical protein JG688_00011287 [Phytophthora aleatoria]|uniref:Helitron helicase-like domain-containing protein n=1 Tax=Phytophthora aleatoria TaxID=2496075 RepID=A0A8J5M128_9STRA|nr:hypothetical protein JG688_00011287 [Phytophthora aleatoria]